MATRPRRVWSGRRAWLLAVVLLAGCAPPAPAVAPPAVTAARVMGPLRIDFVAVGQGDAALVTSPAGKTVLIDGGPGEGRQALVAALRSRGVGPLDLVVLTHRHDDHLGGLAEVVRLIGARLFLDSAVPHASPKYDMLLRELQARQVPVRDATVGRRIDLGGGATMTVLAPPAPPLSGTRSDVNANSVVLLLQLGEVRVLFTGDAEAATERWLLRSGAPLRAQVLKVAHHGSRFSSTPEFLRAVAPGVAVISVGARNEHGHPAPETVAALERAQARVFRTDRDGDVTVETDGARLEVRTAHGHREQVAVR